MPRSLEIGMGDVVLGSWEAHVGEKKEIAEVAATPQPCFLWKRIHVCIHIRTVDALTIAISDIAWEPTVSLHSTCMPCNFSNIN